MLEKETSQNQSILKKSCFFFLLEEYLFEESICINGHQTNNKTLAIQLLSLISI